MLFIFNRWLLIPLLMLLAAAAYCGATGRIYNLDMPLRYALLLGATSGWLCAFLATLIAHRRYHIDWPTRLSNAHSGGMEFLILFFPGIVFLAAPVWFILTGELWTAVIMGIVAAVVTAKTKFPIL